MWQPAILHLKIRPAATACKTAFSQRGESGQMTPGGLVFGIQGMVYDQFARPARLGAEKRG
jgi:hypothetical protein